MPPPFRMILRPLPLPILKLRISAQSNQQLDHSCMPAPSHHHRRRHAVRSRCVWMRLCLWLCICIRAQCICCILVSPFRSAVKRRQSTPVLRVWISAILTQVSSQNAWACYMRMMKFDSESYESNAPDYLTQQPYGPGPGASASTS